MESTTLRWWRAPAWLEDDDTVWDPARAEWYNTQDLGYDVLFDLAAVTTAREAAAFVAAYGPLTVSPDGPPRERTNTQLLWASNARLWLQIQHARQTSTAAAVRAKHSPDQPEEALAAAHAALLVQAPTATLLEVIHERLKAVRSAPVLLGLCPTCGRFFARQDRSPKARYCRAACAATAAKWRERRPVQARSPDLAAPSRSAPLP
jgi:hypothetical protein